jgi:hypothetical protein
MLKSRSSKVGQHELPAGLGGAVALGKFLQDGNHEGGDAGGCGGGGARACHCWMWIRGWLCYHESYIGLKRFTTVRWPRCYVFIVHRISQVKGFTLDGIDSRVVEITTNHAQDKDLSNPIYHN